MLFGGVTEVPCISGAEVFFVNGILSDPYDSARDLSDKLASQIHGTPLESRCINISPVLNESHGPLEDLLQAIDQIWLGAASTFWRVLANLVEPTAPAAAFIDRLSREITRLDYVISEDLAKHIHQYHNSSQTRSNKVVLIGHSQGNLYTSRAYGLLTTQAPFLTSSGLRVIAVATPESSVAGGGPYTTLVEDYIANVLFLIPNPFRLTPNTQNIAFPVCVNHWFCHSFVDSYLEGAASRTRILNDLVDTLTSFLIPPPPPLNQPPTAGFTMTSIPLQPVTHGQTLNLTVPLGGSATVIFDGSFPRSSDPDGTVTGWQWSINSAAASTSSSFSRVFGAGTYSIHLVVTDNQGAPSQAVIGTVVVRETTPPLTSTWTRILPATQPPGERQATAMAYDDVRGEIVLFGGASVRSPSPFGDTWIWNGTTWIQKFPAHQPSARGGHAMVYDTIRQEVVMFGGVTNNETWIWDGNDWRQILSASAPAARAGHRMAFDEERGVAVLFGGSTPLFGGSTFGDTWEWNGTTWVERTPALGNPPGRVGHSMAYDRNARQVVMFGGARLGPDLGDTWTWNGTAWQQQSPPTSPSPREYAPMTFDPVTQTVLLWGGFNDTFLNDTWSWNGRTWAEINIGGTAPRASEFGAGLVGDRRNGASILFLVVFPGTQQTWRWK